MAEIPRKLGKVDWDDLIVSTLNARSDADTFSEQFYTKETGFSVSVGIPAYNEEKNIANLLNALLKQKTNRIAISEIIVISSGSTDRTDAIVEKLSWKDRRIILIRQDHRKGKASAVNEFIKTARSSILVLESADTLPDEQTIERLCLPFEDPIIGMAGAHVTPTNDENTFIGYTSHLLWSMHDQIAMRCPKCGELVAFRKTFESIPEDTVADEAWIEYEMKKRNLKIVYVPDATIFNKGPETISDLVKQRRRIAYGHLNLAKKTRFKVSTLQLPFVLPALLSIFPLNEPKKWFFAFGAFTLESVSRILGYYDYYIKRDDHSTWDIAKTTKQLDLRTAEELK
jgi:biofilm PGA synthesis N-glycosyltransferase PgaC